MHIYVIAKTGKRETNITQEDNNTYTIAVKERPIEGKANKAIIRILAKHLKVSPSSVHIVSGLSSKRKVLEISAST